MNISAATWHAVVYLPSRCRTCLRYIAIVCVSLNTFEWFDGLTVVCFPLSFKGWQPKGPEKAYENISQ